MIEPHLPVYPGGRPRETDLRDIVDAIFYLLRTGCQWRYFDEWRHNGALDRIHDLLRTKVRAKEKPYSPRTTATVDSQSIDTTTGGEARGRDNARNVDGRKRHIAVDGMGLLLAVLVTAAGVDDARAAPELFARLEGRPMSRVGRMFADEKYHNHALYARVTDNAPWDLVVVRRPQGSEGWVKLPIRWTAGRTFVWLIKCRRLAKDHERSTLSSAAFVKLGMIRLMLNRLRPKNSDAKFCYRPAA